MHFIEEDKQHKNYQTIDDYKHEIELYQKTTTTLKQKIIYLEKEIDGYQKKLNHSKKEITQLKRYINTMFHTLSWKLTYPLRRLHYIFPRALVFPRKIIGVLKQVPTLHVYCQLRSKRNFSRELGKIKKQTTKLSPSQSTPDLSFLHQHKLKIQPGVSFIFLTYNGLSDHFKDTLESVLKQKMVLPWEIIVIDSGSTDGTVEFIKQHSKTIKLHQIPNSEFGHGITRQLGANLAQREFLVFLSQDATPTNNLWLANLLRNFNDPEVVGVCSRVIPRDDASSLKKIEVSKDLSYRTEKIVAKIDNLSEFYDLPFNEKRINYYFFNNVSAAIRNSYLIANPFPNVVFAEDVEFARAALYNGKKIIFDPESVVYHSHKYTAKNAYDRALLDAQYHKQYLGISNVPNMTSVFLNTLKRVMQDVIVLKYDLQVTRKISALAYSPIIHFAEQLGQYRGAKS